MASEQERLLVVDDDPELLKLLHQALCDVGFDCHKAADGREALSQLKQAGFDLVVLDWTLPDLEGIEVLRLIQEAIHPQQQGVIGNHRQQRCGLQPQPQGRQ